jgi:hypothetical protein
MAHMHNTHNTRVGTLTQYYCGRQALYGGNAGVTQLLEEAHGEAQLPKDGHGVEPHGGAAAVAGPDADGGWCEVAVATAAV